MLENEEIGGTTFTEMVEDIIVDSGLKYGTHYGICRTRNEYGRTVLYR